jgi:3-methyladenine DNA glycosylase AlkD
VTTAAEIIAELHEHASPVEHRKIAKRIADPSTIIGVRMGAIFELAKKHTSLTLDEVDELLQSPFYEARIAAISILDFKTRLRGNTDDDRRRYYELYLKRHDHIDTWDLVDRAAPRVVGWYLLDKPRDILHELAQSSDPWRRRTAITACFMLIRNGLLDDGLEIAELLVDDPEVLVRNSVGVALREIGRVDASRRDAFLAANAERISAPVRRMALTA